MKSQIKEIAVQKKFAKDENEPWPLSLKKSLISVKYYLGLPEIMVLAKQA